MYYRNHDVDEEEHGDDDGHRSTSEDNLRYLTHECGCIKTFFRRMPLKSVDKTFFRNECTKKGVGSVLIPLS